MNDASPMVPSPNWGEVAAGFAERQGRQNLLCAPCVRLGNVSPPADIVILNGESVCLDHIRDPRTEPHL